MSEDYIESLRHTDMYREDAQLPPQTINSNQNLNHSNHSDSDSDSETDSDFDPNNVDSNNSDSNNADPNIDTDSDQNDTDVDINSNSNQYQYSDYNNLNNETKSSELVSLSTIINQSYDSNLDRFESELVSPSTIINQSYDSNLDRFESVSSNIFNFKLFFLKYNLDENTYYNGDIDYIICKQHAIFDKHITQNDINFCINQIFVNLNTDFFNNIFNKKETIIRENYVFILCYDDYTVVLDDKYDEINLKQYSDLMNHKCNLAIVGSNFDLTKFSELMTHLNYPV